MKRSIPETIPDSTNRFRADKEGFMRPALVALTWCVLGRQVNWELSQEELIDGARLLMSTPSTPGMH